MNRLKAIGCFFTSTLSTPHRLLTVAVVSTVMMSLSGGASAGFFDKLKEKAEKAVQESLPDVGAEKRKVENAATVPLEKAAQKSSPSGNSAASTAPLINSVEYLMQRWPYNALKGTSTREFELRGVRLGQPFPDAHKTLLDAGFSYVNQVGNTYNYRMQYVEAAGQRKWIPQSEVSQVRKQSDFKIIRDLQLSIEAVTPSKEIMAELAPYPANMLQAQNGNQAVANEPRRSRESRARRTATAAMSAPQLSGEPLYVSSIEYLQRFITGEQVNWDALLEKAREQFGEPNYGIADIQRQGDAYKTSNAKSLWYLDAALEDRERVRKILSTVEPGKPQAGLRQMVWKDMMHPGIFANVSYATQGFDDYGQAVEAMRVAGAPFMGITLKDGFRIKLSWPFLKYEASSRRIYNKRQAKLVQPKADVKF